MIDRNISVDGITFVPVKALHGITISDDDVYTYGDDMFVDTSCSMSFKFKNKDWYRIRKLLGMYKPIYKRKKKGKRYVLYEISG